MIYTKKWIIYNSLIYRKKTMLIVQKLVSEFYGNMIYFLKEHKTFLLKKISIFSRFMKISINFLTFLRTFRRRI